MDLFAIDDSAQKKPSRDGVGPLVAVGGIHVPGSGVRELELSLDELCVDTGFPEAEEFKWSPAKKSWQYKELHDEQRDEFFLAALGLARDAGAVAIVVVEDTNKQRATDQASSHEEDVTMLFLERAHNHMTAGDFAIVVFDRPGGDRRAETDFLATTLATLRSGTTYAALDRLALAVSTDSKLSRLVQLADVVTACTTSFVAGESRYAPKIFEEGILPMLRQEAGRVGGCGLKIHPDHRYGNLYHWLLGDETLWKGRSGISLPSSRFTCYHESPDVA